jgi:hypothetical protein
LDRNGWQGGEWNDNDRRVAARQASMTVKRFNLRKEKRRLKEMKLKGRTIYLTTAISYGHFVLRDESNGMKLWSPKRSQEELRALKEEPEGDTRFHDQSSIFFSTPLRKTWNGRFA